MAIITSTSRIKSTIDITDQFDMAMFNDCTECKKKPRVKRITWGRGNSGVITACDENNLHSVFDDLPRKWNRFNPNPDSE